MTAFLHRLGFLAALGLVFLGGSARADDDHERARRAFESGEIVSLASILARVEQAFEGELLEVELEGADDDDDDEALVYDVKLLAPGGSIVALRFDARSGELLRAAGHDLERLERKDDDD